MTKAVLPIRKRKASFITTNDYRITSLYVIDEAHPFYTRMQPSVHRSPTHEHLNIIFIGTDNGRLMRIAHYFSNNYFKNDNLDEENVEILEEIQLFDRQTAIKEISILKRGDQSNVERLFAISDKQIKSISLDFCELYSDSCESCVQNNNFDRQNARSVYNSKCYWINDSCRSSLSGTESIRSKNLTEHATFSYCEYLKMMKTSTESTSTTTTTTTTTYTTIATTADKSTTISLTQNETLKIMNGLNENKNQISSAYLNNNFLPKLMEKNNSGKNKIALVHVS
jgi:hypothetical protein